MKAWEAYVVTTFVGILSFLFTMVGIGLIVWFVVYLLQVMGVL